MSEIERLRGLVEELEHLFKLQYLASQRATKQWQAANPGNDHVWPDAAKLQTWLMEEVDRLEKMLAKAEVFRFSTGAYGITVEHRGKDKWVVCEGSGFCLNRDGEFEHEPLPSSRTDEYLARTRFTFKEAWDLAEQQVKKAEENDGGTN